jgi:hypothetical protein
MPFCERLWAERKFQTAALSRRLGIDGGGLVFCHSFGLYLLAIDQKFLLENHFL